jgi:hypothetical protein
VRPDRAERGDAGRGIGLLLTPSRQPGRMCGSRRPAAAVEFPLPTHRRLRAAWTRAACRPTRRPSGAMSDERRRCGRSIGCQKKGRRRPLPESRAGKHRGRRAQPVSSPQFFGNHSGVRATCENPGRTPRYKSLTFEWVSDGSGGRDCRLHLGSRHRAGAGVSHSVRLVRDSMSCLGVEAKNTKEWRPE